MIPYYGGMGSKAAERVHDVGMLVGREGSLAESDDVGGFDSKGQPPPSGVPTG